MGLLRKKSVWRRATDALADNAPSAASVAKPVLTAVGGAVSLIAASATVSSMRGRKQRQQQ